MEMEADSKKNFYSTGMLVVIVIGVVAIAYAFYNLRKMN